MLYEGNRFFAEVKHRAVFFDKCPVEPAYSIILSVGIVVTPLGSQELVPAQEHGCAQGKEKTSEHVFSLPASQGDDMAVIRFPFRAAVPRAVVPGAVAVVLAVVLVVLVVV